MVGRRRASSRTRSGTSVRGRRSAPVGSSRCTHTSTCWSCGCTAPVQEARVPGPDARALARARLREHGRTGTLGTPGCRPPGDGSRCRHDAHHALEVLPRSPEQALQLPKLANPVLPVHVVLLHARRVASRPRRDRGVCGSPRRAVPCRPAGVIGRPAPRSAPSRPSSPSSTATGRATTGAAAARSWRVPAPSCRGPPLHLEWTRFAGRPGASARRRDRRRSAHTREVR